MDIIDSHGYGKAVALFRAVERHRHGDTARKSRTYAGTRPPFAMCGRASRHPSPMLSLRDTFVGMREGVVVRYPKDL